MKRPHETIAHKSKAFTIEDFIARSGAGESSLTLYEEELRRLERELGMPLAQASDRALGGLKKRLRQQLSGPQRALFLRMFYKAAFRATKEQRYADLVELMRLKQRLRRMSPAEILTLPEVNKLMDAANSLRDRAMIALLWETGARIHEVCALRLQDVKEFTSKENGGRLFLSVFFPKVKVAGEEHSSLLIESVDHVKAWARAHPDPRPAAPLFLSARGTPLTRNTAEKIIKKTADRAGLPKRVYPHLFRHSRCTHLLRIGVPEAQVKKLLGWKSNSPMLARYEHLVDRDAYAALLRAHGLEPPEPPQHGALVATEGELRPVVPMVLGPHVGARPTPQEPGLNELSKRLGELETALDESGFMEQKAELLELMNGVVGLKKQIEKLLSEVILVRRPKKKVPRAAAGQKREVEARGPTP